MILTRFLGVLAVLAGGYETVAVVLSELHRLRTICRTGIAEGGEQIFPQVQDKELFKAVLDACRNEELWSFISAAGREVFGPLEDSEAWLQLRPTVC